MLNTVTVVGGPSNGNKTWTGATSTDWFTHTNWNPPCVPNCDALVTIPAATNAPAISTGTAQAHDLTINNGQVNLQGGNLDICGNYNDITGGMQQTGGTVRFVGTTDQSATVCCGAGGPAFGDVEVATQGVLTVDNMRIAQNGSLTFAGTGAGEGIVSATPGNLILHAPATITGYAQSAPPATQDYNFVDGTVQWTTDPAQATYDFPVGDATNGLQRMSITRNDVAADGITSLEASYDHTPPGIPANQNQCGINTPSPWTQNLYPGKFVFHANGGAAYTLPASSYDLEMAFRGTLPPGPEYGVLIDHGSGWEYAKVNSGPSPTSCVQPPQASPITAPGLTQFSEGSGIGNSLPFPFELLSFSARHIDGVNTLQWQTASETNNRGFDIQRAQALGERFESIGFVEGAGNSQRELSYAHPDADVLPGQTYYYRLVQEDFDGTRTPSPVVQVYVPESGEQYLQLYPNPATNQLTLSATQPLQTIVVRSSIGQEVLRQDAANEMQVELDVSALSAGVYLLQTDGQALRFVKQ